MKWVVYEKCLEQCLAQSKPSACVCGSNHCCHLYSHHHHHQRHHHHHQHHLIVVTIITTLPLIIVAAILGQVLVDDVDCQGW